MLPTDARKLLMIPFHGCSSLRERTELFGVRSLCREEGHPMNKNHMCETSIPTTYLFDRRCYKTLFGKFEPENLLVRCPVCLFSGQFQHRFVEGQCERLLSRHQDFCGL